VPGWIYPRRPPHLQNSITLRTTQVIATCLSLTWHACQAKFSRITHFTRGWQPGTSVVGEERVDSGVALGWAGPVMASCFCNCLPTWVSASEPSG
jgi:hypothetical protein